MEKIKVLIADDHRVVREGLAAILKTKDDIHIVGEAQDGMEAVEKVRDVGSRRCADGCEHAQDGRSRSDQTNQAGVPSHRSRGLDHV